MSLNPAVTRLAKFFFLAALMGHLIGCFWFWVASLQAGVLPPAHLWISALHVCRVSSDCHCSHTDDVNTWIRAFHLEDAPVWDQYINAMYWTYATITVCACACIVPGLAAVLDPLWLTDCFADCGVWRPVCPNWH